jgi:beta-1,2-mannobiose phosphorylase / 1,2-beta-oligomannan phosphorylase
MTIQPPRVERLHNGAPILQKEERHAWENKVTFNPAAVLVTDAKKMRMIARALPVGEARRKQILQQQGLVVLLYRAQGRKTEAYDYTRSALGLAVCSPELNLLARLEKPVVLPDQSYENLGVEDPRITRVGDQFVMIYTGYATGPERNIVRICIATSDDLVHWKKRGPLSGVFNTLDNKNGMLFEPDPGKKLLMLHRPMEGENPMMVHWAESDDVLGEWTTRGVLIRPLPNPAFKDVWVGGGAPPMRLADGRYLLLYHIGNRDAEGKREYDLGIALYDPGKQDPIVKRLEPLLRPTSTAETNGDADLGVNNVVFVCAAYFWGGHLYFPYAGADSCVLGGRIVKEELDAYLNA